MTNADKFKHLFGIYATELWAMSENDFLEWLNADAQDMPAEEQRTGRWIPVDSYSAYGGDEEAWMAHGNPTAFYYCSECKEQNYMGEDGEPLLTEYCPSCGARMQGWRLRHESIHR